MFEDSLIESGGRFRSKRGKTTLLSFVLQILLIGVLVLLPLIFTEASPCFTVTSRDRTPTSWSPASLTRTASLIVSSVICGGSLARQTACIRNSARKAAKSLCIVFSGHCTPVEGIEKAAVLPPVGLHANVQVQIDLEPEQALHFLAGQGADLLQHGAAGA